LRIAGLLGIEDDTIMAQIAMIVENGAMSLNPKGPADAKH
jgi:hypothetical protein